MVLDIFIYSAYWKKSLIMEAMEHWENNTRFNNTDEYCVKFVERDTQDNYVNFVYTDGYVVLSSYTCASSFLVDQVAVDPLTSS